MVSIILRDLGGMPDIILKIKNSLKVSHAHEQLRN